MVEYFKEMYETIQNNWNVKSAIKHLGTGKSNEGSEESKFIKRYYIEPNDKRFLEIYLNFDSNNNIESIVWFFDKNKSLFLAELKELFGSFITQHVIYDETTDLCFQPTQNKNIEYVKTTILEWVEKRKDGTLFFKKENQEIDIDENYKVTSIIFKIANLT